jgi:hypothetical protein
MSGKMNPRCALNTNGNCVLKNTAESRLVLYKPLSPIRNKELERSFEKVIEHNRRAMAHLLDQAKKSISTNDSQSAKQSVIDAYRR